MKMMNCVGAKATLSAMSVASLLAASAAVAQDLPEIRVQAVAGSIGAIPLLIVENEKLDEKHGFTAKADYLSIDGGFQSFLVGNYDITNDNDIIGIATARNEGFDVTSFFPNGYLYLGIVVPGDSEAKSPADLKGKRVGHFGTESGTTSFIRVIVQDLYGFDVTKEYNLQQVGPAALVPLMDSGQVEAIFNFEPYVSNAMVMTDGRYLMQATQAYKEKYDGFSPWIGVWAAQTEWLKSNPELATGFRDALQEANQMIADSNYEILRKPYIAKGLGIENEAVLDRLIENGRATPYFTSEWTPELVSKAQSFLERLASEKIMIEAAPEGTMVVLEELLGTAKSE